MEVTRILGKDLIQWATTVDEIIDRSWQMVKRQKKLSKGQWLSRFICVAWEIWKQRNAVIFRDQKLPPKIVANRCLPEMNMWLKWC